jgi:hypothetical protein
MVPSHEIRQALSHSLESVALNERQHLLIFNPDPEVNSLAERIVHLRRHGVPTDLVAALVADVRRLLELNAAEGHGTRTVASRLDDLASALAHAERNEAVVAAVSIKRLAGQLRPHLATLRQPSTDGTAYFRAAATVKDIVRSTPRSRLTSPTMRRQLGAGPHAQLLDLMGTVA